MNNRLVRALGLIAIVVVAVQPGPSMALDAPKPQANALASKEFYKPELRLSSSNVPFEQAFDALLNKDAWSRFGAAYGQPQVYIDPRSGAATGVVTRIPLIPGRGEGNKLRLADVGAALGHKVDAIDRKTVADLVRRFAARSADALGIDPAQLGAARAEQVTEHLWHVLIPQTVNGVPVRYGHMVAVINSGNLVSLGTETWGNAIVDTKPKILEDQALAIGFAYVGGRVGADEMAQKPNLEILPVAPQEFQAGEGFAGPIGMGYRHRLVWSFGFQRKGVDGRWEVIVDAHTGEVLSFEDTNHYASREITGGVYPLTSTEICPSNDRCGQMFPGYPMPWANTGLAPPNNFTNSAGLFDYTSGIVTTSFNGKYVEINDSCGAMNETASGSILLGGLNGQHDCTSAGASPGDTPAARSAFYEVNKLMEQARGWIPGNAWLQQQMQANVNIQNTCNAFYSTLDGTINFYRSGGGCRNTGEIAAVFDHEWGHAFDDNDSGGSLSTSSEAYADIAAIYRLQASCVGYGFFQTVNDGCGMTSDGTGFNSNESQTGTHCDSNCSGVRDADWARHSDNTPDTPQNFSCTHCGSGSGPCGRQVHCDAAPTRQAAWDLVNRDLTAAPFNMSLNDAYIVGNKLFYQGSGVVGSWHACTCPSTSDGCGATNGYMAWLAADDDNGNLADGTPHMTAIHAAFARHNLACATPTPTNSGCAGGPTTAPNLTVAVGSNSLSLSWGAVPGASSYRVLRSEGYAGCDFGKAVIANVAGTNYTDPDVANGRTYNYVVQAVGASGACFGPGSACVQGTPQPCAGSIQLSQSLYNCGGAPLNITLVDGDLTGVGTQMVSISSATEPGPSSLSLTETPANSGVFTGTFGTTTAAPSPVDGAISIANGDTISVTYLDVDYCGAPNVNVTQVATVDCAGPIITNVQVSNLTGNSADVTFDTNEPTDAVAFFGTVPPPAGSFTNANLTTSHTVHLSGLTGCTAYVASVQATDPAGNTAADDNGGLYYGFITLVNVFPTFVYTGPDVQIPDNTTVTASLTITDTRVVQGVKAKIVNLTHTYDGDLDITLIGPTGIRVDLSTNNGGTGENFINTVFDDAAATSITAGAAPFTGTFKPEGVLSTLNGISAAGIWKLEVKDEAGSDTGTLTDWEIELQFPAEQCPTVGQVSLDKVSYQCSETLQIHVVDFSIVGAVTLPVTIASATEGGETVILDEIPANSGSFVGDIVLTTASASTGDDYLSITDGDSVTVTYIDADDGYGGFNIPRTDTAIVDCSGPAISDVQAINVTGRTADITWTTGELSNSEAFYGIGPTPTTPLSSAALVTSHSLHLTGLAPCTTYLFYVRSTDATNNSTLDDNAGIYFTFTTLSDNQPVFAYTGAAAAIPDNSVLGVSVPVAVADVKEILDLNVKVSITHPNVGDLEVFLIVPDGQQISLALRRGGTGDNFTNTVFDDAAATSIINGTAPFTGSFRPETPLSTLNGQLSNGTWKLRVRDRATGSTGTVTAWSLQMTYPTLGCDLPFVQEASHSVADSCSIGSSNAVVDPGDDLSIPFQLVNTGNAPVSNVVATLSTATAGVTFPNGAASYGALAIGQTASGDAPFAVAIDSSVPCGTLINFDVNVAANEGGWTDSFPVRVGTAVFGQTTSPSTDTPMPIPDVRQPPTLSIRAISDPGVVNDVNVVLNLTHTWNGDLDLVLIGPNGTRVELSTDNGGNGDNYTNTVFDDAAATAITAGTTPFTGTFRPEGSLASLNGITAAGNWTLEITDDGNNDSGNLLSWSLVLTTPNGYSCNSCVLVAPGEVAQLMFTAKDAVQWSAVSGATDYYLYRGASANLPSLLDGNVDSCERGTTASLTMTGLTEVPASGAFDWYLVRARNAVGYGSPGDATAGARVHDSGSLCP